MLHEFADIFSAHEFETGCFTKVEHKIDPIKLPGRRGAIETKRLSFANCSGLEENLEVCINYRALNDAELMSSLKLKMALTHCKGKNLCQHVIYC